jgi:tetratricopeptide (TPR) repeat protein
MKKTGSLLIFFMLVGAVVATGTVFWRDGAIHSKSRASVPESQYGAFLAAQHAIYVNDFDAAKDFSGALTATDVASVQNIKMMSQFLAGTLPENVDELKKESGTPARLIYDAWLVNNDKWDELYSRHKNDTSALAAPLRIWSSVAVNHKTEVLKFVESLETRNAWKSFVRGQIYAETGDIDKAKEEFIAVSPSFMNINDYLYIMSFYIHHGFDDFANDLKNEFTAQPGGMFMADFNNIPDWSEYSGIKNALAFSLIQNVSHTQVMMYSDLAVLLLRFAQVTGAGVSGDTGAINYYLGQYFFNNNGDYEKYFSQIKSSSPYYPFAMLRMAEGAGDVLKLRSVLREYPTFVPAINKLVAYHISHGNKRAALRIINRALNNDALSDYNHGFFLKSRAQIYFAFGDLTRAQADLRAAADVLIIDGEISALQAKIWAAENRELDTAYEYAIGLVKQNPSDVFAWDVLGRVVAAREGVDAAIEMLARVAEVANTCSSLFDNLGDLYALSGNTKMARDAYLRAIELSDDGLVVAPRVQQKLRNMK